jgi:SHS2 domain-containing protein
LIKRALRGALFCSSRELVECALLRYNYKMPDYTYFDHTADIGVEISGRTKKELFVHAAGALFDIMIENSTHKKAGKIQKQQKTMTITGADTQDLLINFLRELLFLFNGERCVVKRCEIMECGNKKIKARLAGERYNNNQHLIKTEIKAVTYSGLTVKKIKSNWMARVIFDV